MRCSQKQIAGVLTAHGFAGTSANIMTIEDALEWEDREDYDSTIDAIEAVIEDREDELAKEVTK